MMGASMTGRPPIMERAFVLARSGSCRHVSEIRSRLKGEGYMLVEDFITGKSLVSTLKQLCLVALGHVVTPIARADPRTRDADRGPGAKPNAIRPRLSS